MAVGAVKAGAVAVEAGAVAVEAGAVAVEGGASGADVTTTAVGVSSAGRCVCVRACVRAWCVCVCVWKQWPVGAYSFLC